MKSNSLPFIAVIISIIFWSLDAVIDFYIFGSDSSIIAEILTPEPVELWMRIVVVSLFISFSFYAKKLLTKQSEISNQLEQHKKELEILATTDPLTLLPNRREFSRMLAIEIAREQRSNSGFLLVMCDIDYFKKVNDKYGHNIGDDVLKSFAKILMASTREMDMIARWGGEEFALLIPNSNIQLASTIVNKIRERIESTNFKDVGNITASFGVTSYKENDDEQSLFSRADKVLYKAKENGRNRIEINI